LVTGIKSNCKEAASTVIPPAMVFKSMSPPLLLELLTCWLFGPIASMALPVEINTPLSNPKFEFVPSKIAMAQVSPL
jgi:hypothetical protein